MDVLFLELNMLLFSKSTCRHFPKAHLTSHSMMSGSRWMITIYWLSGSWRYILCNSSVYSCHILISSASVRSIPFLSFIVPVFAWNVPLVSLRSKVKVKIPQLCPSLCDLMDYPDHRILQATILEWVAFPYSKGSSQPRDGDQVSHIAGGFFTSWVTTEAQEYGSGWSG